MVTLCEEPVIAQKFFPLWGSRDDILTEFDHSSPSSAACGCFRFGGNVMKQKVCIVLCLMVFVTCVIAQSECAEIITVADATVHAGINLEYRQTDLGGLVTRIWDPAGAFDVRDDLCVVVNGMEINAAVAVEEVFSGDIIEWWVSEPPFSLVFLVTSFAVE